MRTERLFALPETIEDTAGIALEQYAQHFEEHLSALERERACSDIVKQFQRYVNLSELSFFVRDAADDETTLRSAYAKCILDVNSTFQGCGREQDTWDETCDISQALSVTLTPRTIDFYDGLRLLREQLVSPLNEPLFPDVRALRNWVELDLR